MVQIDVENVEKLYKLSQQYGSTLTREKIIDFTITFQEIIRLLILNNQEYQLALGKHKLQSKFKRYHGTQQLIVSVKRNKN